MSTNNPKSTKTALITGASSGLGKIFAFQLAKMGYNLFLVSRNETGLKEIKEELETNYNIEVKFYIHDLSDMVELKKLTDEVIKIDLLINGAGFGLFGNFTETDTDKELNMIDLNIKGLYYLTKIYAKRMQQQKVGGIINIASTAAFQPIPGFGVYAASKSFVLNLTLALAKELKSHGVRIMALCPGPTKTNFWTNAEFNKLPGFVNLTMMNPEKVVKICLRDFKMGKIVCIPGIKNKLSSYLGRIIPYQLSLIVLKRFFPNK